MDVIASYVYNSTIWILQHYLDTKASYAYNSIIHLTALKLNSAVSLWKGHFCLCLESFIQKHISACRAWKELLGKD